MSTSKILGSALGLGLFLAFERERLKRLVTALFARRQQMRRKQSARALAGSLAEAGFFLGLPPDIAASLRKSVEVEGYRAVFSHPWRSLNADDEELAKGQVGLILKGWVLAFTQLGLAPLAGSDRWEENGAHYLDLATECLTLISPGEALDDRRDAKEHFSSGAVAARLLEYINHALAAAGQADRFHSVYSGKDAHVLILTPTMLATIVGDPTIRADHLPYIRTAEWPEFGMPRYNSG